VPIKVIIYLGTCIGACLASWSTARLEGKREADTSAPGATNDLERGNKKRRLGLNPTLPGAVAPGGLAGDPRRPTTLDTRRHFRYYIPPVPEDLQNSKATKGDDAEIPVHLWNNCLAYLVGAVRLSEEQERRLGFLWRCTHHYWIRCVRESWWTWWRENKSLLGLVEPKHWWEIGRRGMAAVNYASLSSFWDWDWGSAVFFWRWQRGYQLEVAMGLAPCWVGAKPTSLELQRGLGGEEDMDKLRKKIQKFLDRGYVSERVVKALDDIVGLEALTASNTPRSEWFDPPAWQL
jgi:hypothetical protein